MRKRLLIVLAVGLLLAQVAVIAASVECRCCPCGTTDNDCPHACETCLSSSMARMVVPSELGLRTLSPIGTVPPAPLLPRCAAMAQDIFHVPRPSLA